MAGEKQKEVGVVGITLEQVKELIAEALKGLATEEGVKILIVDESKNIGKLIAESLKGLVTEERAREIFQEELDETFVLGKELHPLAATIGVIGKEEEPPLDPEHLEGLMFRGSRPKKTNDGTVHVPFERALTPDDVHDYRDDGTHMVIVAKDGQKHRVKK